MASYQALAPCMPPPYSQDLCAWLAHSNVLGPAACGSNVPLCVVSYCRPQAAGQTPLNIHTAETFVSQINSYIVLLTLLLCLLHPQDKMQQGIGKKLTASAYKCQARGNIGYLISVDIG